MSRLRLRGLKVRQAAVVLVFVLGLYGRAASEDKVAQELSISDLFKTAQFDRWAVEPAHQDIFWKARTYIHGLSVHQRMVAHIEIDVPLSELSKRIADETLLMLVQVEDDRGQRYRDYGLIDVKATTQEVHKGTSQSTWEAFALPGDYKVSFLLYDKASGEHSFAQRTLHVPVVKHDDFEEIWQGMPKWEFWGALTEFRDNIYRPDIHSHLHLVLATRKPVQVDVLADLTPSDLFHGSARFYSRFLSVALPLVKDLSEIQVTNGTLNVSALDLRQRKITFEQDKISSLNWPALKSAVAPENGPDMIDVRGLEAKQERPDFLRDEILRRLNPDDEKEPASATSVKAATPFHVFIVVGSPMDFYAFRHFPSIDPAEAENCVVYYLQYEVYAPYATGALGSVRKMLKPLQIHTFKVRSAESVREALERIVKNVGQM